MFGGLHVEMGALKTIGDWLDNSGWAQALVQVEIATARMADSLLKATHVMHTRRAHQITAAALHILQHCAYDHYSLSNLKENQTQMSFEAWHDERKLNCPQFHYWTTTMELEVCILTAVLKRSKFCNVFRCLNRACSLVLCTRSYELCSLDTSAFQRYG